MYQIIYVKQLAITVGLSFMLLLSLSMSVEAQYTTTNYFPGTIEEAFNVAQTYHRLLFIKVFKDPCPGCQVLENYLSSSFVANELQKNYLCYQMDVTAFSSMDFFERINISVDKVPLLLVMDPKTRTLIGKRNEIGNPQSLLEFLTKNYDSFSPGTPPVAVYKPPVNDSRPERYGAGQCVIKAMPEQKRNEKYVPLAEIIKGQTVRGRPEQVDERQNRQAAVINERQNGQTELETQYKNGNRSDDVMMAYIRALKKNNSPIELPMREFLEDKSENDRSPEFVQFIYEFSDGVETDAMRFLVKNLPYYKDKYGYANVNNKLKSAIEKSIKNAIAEKDNEILFDRSMEIIDYVEMEKKHFFKFEMQSKYYIGRNKWDDYAECSKRYVEEYKVSDPGLLNEIAYNYHLYISDKRKLNDALKWINESVQYASEYENNLTYARLAYKAGKYGIAKYRVLLAIEIAKIRNINHSEADVLNDKLGGVLPEK